MSSWPSRRRQIPRRYRAVCIYQAVVKLRRLIPVLHRERQRAPVAQRGQITKVGRKRPPVRRHRGRHVVHPLGRAAQAMAHRRQPGRAARLPGRYRTRIRQRLGQGAQRHPGLALEIDVHQRQRRRVQRIHRHDLRVEESGLGLVVQLFLIRGGGFEQQVDLLVDAGLPVGGPHQKLRGLQPVTALAVDLHQAQHAGHVAGIQRHRLGVLRLCGRRIARLGQRHLAQLIVQADAVGAFHALRRARQQGDGVLPVTQRLVHAGQAHQRRQVLGLGAQDLPVDVGDAVGIAEAIHPLSIQHVGQAIPVAAAPVQRLQQRQRAAVVGQQGQRLLAGGDGLVGAAQADVAPEGDLRP